MYALYSWLVAVCLCGVFYGLIRYGIALLRHEENAEIYMLWIPGSGLLFAILTALFAEIVMYYTG